MVACFPFKFTYSVHPWPVPVCDYNREGDIVCENLCGFTFAYALPGKIQNAPLYFTLQHSLPPVCSPDKATSFHVTLCLSPHPPTYTHTHTFYETMRWPSSASISSLSDQRHWRYNKIWSKHLPPLHPRVCIMCCFFTPRLLICAFVLITTHPYTRALCSLCGTNFIFSLLQQLKSGRFQLIWLKTQPLTIRFSESSSV